MDTATSDIRAVEFTPSRDGDSPVLPDLLKKIPVGENISTVTADRAYDTRLCHTAILARDAVPIISIRKNGRSWKEDCPAAIAKNETLRATRYYAEPSGSDGQDTTPAARCPRPPDRRNPHPHRHHEPLQRTRHRRDLSRSMKSMG